MISEINSTDDDATTEALRRIIDGYSSTVIDRAIEIIHAEEKRYLEGKAYKPYDLWIARLLRRYIAGELGGTLTMTINQEVSNQGGSQMKTRKDAEHVVALCETRQRLRSSSDDILADKEIGACGYTTDMLEFVHLADELRNLIKRETDLQIAAIDDELKGLGAVPDELVVE